MEMFYCYLLRFWSAWYDYDEKQMLNVILLVIEQRKNAFDRIVKILFFLFYFYTLRR